ncbi:MAG: hypothetical protein WCW77_00590 [Patescibacteria group bacterium]
MANDSSIMLSESQEILRHKMNVEKKKGFINKLIKWQVAEKIIIIPVLRQTHNALIADITLDEATEEQISELQGILNKSDKK